MDSDILLITRIKFLLYWWNTYNCPYNLVINYLQKFASLDPVLTCVMDKDPHQGLPVKGHRQKYLRNFFYFHLYPYFSFGETSILPWSLLTTLLSMVLIYWCIPDRKWSWLIIADSYLIWYFISLFSYWFKDIWKLGFTTHRQQYYHNIIRKFW